MFHIVTSTKIEYQPRKSPFVLENTSFKIRENLISFLQLSSFDLDHMFIIFYLLINISSVSTVLIFGHLNNGEGNGTPPQYSCLENPMDGGAW